MPAATTRRICLGAIVAAHGLRGEVRVKCFTAVPEAIGAYGPLTDEAGVRQFRLRVLRPAQGGVLAAVEGIADRDAAEALRGTPLYVERSALPPPEEDEYYHADLIGLAVVLPDGTPLGTVSAVHDFGAGDVLEVAMADGRAAVMLPFSREVVPEVDMAGGRLVAVPPPGLLDEGGVPAVTGGPREDER